VSYGLWVDSFACWLLIYTCGWTHKEAQATTSGASATCGPITLYCLVCGNDAENAFKVVIEKDKDINDLKKAIKEENTPAFDHVAAQDLVLWRVNIPISEKSTFELLKSNKADIEEDLMGVKIRYPMTEIGEEFGVQPLKKHIHILITRPPGNVTSFFFTAVCFFNYFNES
jgi:hypothetical protein